MNTGQGIALLSPAVGSGNIGDHLIELAIRRLLGDLHCERFSIRRTLSAEEIERINAMSCAVICGTNLYQYEWESALTPAVLAQIKVPVIPFGVGGSAATLGDTAVGETTLKMIRSLHERCVVSSVRDPHAAAVLDRAGVRNFVLTGCPVLYWAQAPELPGSTARARRRLVVTARNWLMHRWPDAVDHPVQIALLRRIFDRFASQDLVFAVHEEFDRNLVQRLGLPRRLVVDSADPSDYLRLYTDPDNVVFAMRLHAGMLALANGLPTVFVGHDTRTYAFCEMLGLDCIALFDEDCVDRSIAALERVLAGAGALPASASLRFRELRGAMDRFMAMNGLRDAAPGTVRHA
jgi:polysaccharide pyruvyl transferase WcaK-like protein